MQFEYVDTVVEGTEIYCYNTEGDTISVVSQASYRMDVTRLEQCVYIKKAVLRERNASECHSELVEAMRNTQAHSKISPTQHCYFDEVTSILYDA